MSGRSLLERRLIALGLLALLLAALWFFLAAPIARGFAERAAQREQLTDELLRGRRLIGSRAIWWNKALLQRADADQFGMIAPTASAAALQATDRIAAAIQTSGGVLSSLREQPSGPGETRLRVEGRLDLTQLVTSLKLIEDQKPFVIIEGLTVAADPTAAAGQLSPMDIRIDLAVPYLVASR